MNRRLPVYLLLDCSESMAGLTIDTVNKAVHAMVSGLRQNPHALETVHLSVITFSRTAQQVVPLAELPKFQIPELTIHAGTSLGAALRLLMQSIKLEVVRTTAEVKGDWRPLVFLFTDGQPTDAWEQPAAEIAAMRSPRVANIYAIGCGDDVDFSVLHKITDIVFRTPDMSQETIKRAFVWMTASVQSASISVANGKGDALNLDNLPAGALEKVPLEACRDHDPIPRQVFIHACCQKTRKHYLMRFVRLPEERRYAAKESHPLKSFDAKDAAGLPPINSSLLMGVPPCPYCGNGAAAVCGCDGIFCFDPNRREEVACPHCEKPFRAGAGGGGFDVKRSAG